MDKKLGPSLKDHTAHLEEILISSVLVYMRAMYCPYIRAMYALIGIVFAGTYTHSPYTSNSLLLLTYLI